MFFIVREENGWKWLLWENWGRGEFRKNKIMKEEEKEKNVKIIMKFSTVSEEEKVTF